MYLRFNGVLLLHLWECLEWGWGEEVVSVI